VPKARIYALPDEDRSPLDVFACWSDRAYLAALISARPKPPFSRWSILARPTHIVDWSLAEPDPIARLADLVESTRVDRPSEHAQVPFVGGWLVALSYELGRVIEPSSRVHAGREDPAWPAAIVAWRCPNAFVHDAVEGRWVNVQSDANASGPVGLPRSRIGRAASPYALGTIEGIDQAAVFERSVDRAVGLIRAGDVFQVNLAHRLTAAFRGSTRSAFVDQARAVGPWYGAYLEHRAMGRARAVLSASPELLVSLDARTRLLTTRPIKGTRPASAAAADLETSDKDRAELNMIVDLMRNDLGRVASIGSVRVEQARVIERHGDETSGVHQGVATVRATLGRGRSLADLLRATLPGGSITGAPKVRAMQIIEELEPSPRGLYTGAIGFISDCGNACLNVAIRTSVIDAPARDDQLPGEIVDGRLHYGVGAGIVADSHPRAEWLETLDKAGPLRALAGGGRRAGVESRAGTCP
jgi:para-aminobenzoate synthetase component 1